MHPVKSASGSAEKSLPKICPTCGERFGMDALFCPNDGSPLAIGQPGDFGPQPQQPDPYLGRELSGHIEIRQLVGVGAMGRVYRAFQKGIDRDVAVKILHRELSANQQLVTRFHREAKVASRLLHPNVVGVHLVGQLPDGAMYIVMEYLDGLSLQSALAASGGAFDIQRSIHVALQLCDATGEAHQAGVVHRDLKPENVMLVRRGADVDFVKVLDFGIARLNWGEQSMATAAGLIFGTARYISPEGAQGEAVGPTGDVYAMATLIFQMLSGRTPFEGEQAVALLVQQIHDAPPELRSISRASYVPEPIAQVVMKNLSKDPLTREPDGRALGRALIDAAKVAGLSVEDLVARPLLNSGRPAAAMHLPPMQRTNQLQLADVSPLPAWNDRSSAPPPVVAATPTPSPPKPPPEQAAAVDTTLDDIELPQALKQSHPHERTQQVHPIFVEAREDVPVRGSMPSMDDPAIFDAPAEPLPPETPEQTRRRSRSRTVFLFVACFLVGVIGAATLAYRLGYVGTHESDPTSLESYRKRASAAFQTQHWDSPAGDNVQDLTNDGLAKYPRDPRLLEIRAESTDELVKDAVAEKYLGHMDQAAHLAKLAHQLDPTDVAAEHLAAEYGQSSDAIADAGVATTRDAQASTVHTSTTTNTGTAGSVAVPQGGTRAAIDVAPNKPGVLAPVTITIHLTVNGAAPKALPDAISLVVSGPDVPPGTLIPIIADSPATVRGALSFMVPGKFELVFNGKVDGTVVKTSRIIVVDPPGGSQSADGGKWL